MRLEEKFEIIKKMNHPNPNQKVKANDFERRGHRNPYHRNLNYYFEETSWVDSLWMINQSGPPTGFIGAYSYVNDGGYLRDRVLIGRYCSIGRRVTLGPFLHPMDRLSTSSHLRGVKSAPYSDEERTSLYPARKVPKFTVIESDVWIGDGAVIMPGVRIAVGAIIGANSVLTRDAEPYGIYAGAPARKIGLRFSEDTVERLIASSWWNIDHGQLNEMPQDNIFKFVETVEQLLAEGEIKPAGLHTWLAHVD